MQTPPDMRVRAALDTHGLLTVKSMPLVAVVPLGPIARRTAPFPTVLARAELAEVAMAACASVLALQSSREPVQHTALVAEARQLAAPALHPTPLLIAEQEAR